MTPSTPRLFTFDLNGTIADIDGESFVQRVCRASPLPASAVRALLYDELRLKTLPSRSALTDELADRMCRQLGIDRSEFPFGVEEPAPYRLRPGAREAVAAAATHLPVAVVANVSVFADTALRTVSDGLAPHLSAIHASWAMGFAKPSEEAFAAAARFHAVEPADIVHIGDSWHDDVLPVLALGGRAVWLTPQEGVVAWLPTRFDDRLLVASTPAEAVDRAIRRWLTVSRA